MVRRKVQRLEVVVVGLDLRAFADGVAHGLEDRDDLVHHAQHRMLHADGTLNAGKGDIEPLGGELRVRSGGVKLSLSFFNRRLSTSLQLVDPLSYLALGRTGRGFQPDVVDLRQDAVLAGEPAISEGLPVGLVSERRCLQVKSREEISDRTIQRFWGVIVEFGYRI